MNLPNGSNEVEVLLVHYIEMLLAGKAEFH